MNAVRPLIVGAVLLVCAPVSAQIRPCEELRAEIEGKLKAKGVVAFSLEIVPADQIKDQKVVGSCDGGKNKITYMKEVAKKEGSKAAKDK